MLSTMTSSLPGEARLDLLVAQLDPGEHAEMTHEIGGDFETPVKSTWAVAADPPRGCSASLTP